MRESTAVKNRVFTSTNCVPNPTENYFTSYIKFGLLKNRSQITGFKDKRDCVCPWEPTKNWTNTYIKHFYTVSMNQIAFNLVNGNGNTKIQWIAVLFLEIWPASEMSQLLLNSCCKYGFEKTICKQAKPTFFYQNGVENCKKTLKSSRYLVFCEILPASEMSQLLLNSCCKYGFEKATCKQAGFMRQ